jgi:hypothetical protein
MDSYVLRGIGERPAFFYFLGIPADYREVFLTGRQSQFKNPMLYHLS